MGQDTAHVAAAIASFHPIKMPKEMPNAKNCWWQAIRVLPEEEAAGRKVGIASEAPDS